MAVVIKLEQRLSQSLVLTPQLQQSLKLLQMGHEEYLETISQELLENPVLEENPGNEEGDASSAPEDGPDNIELADIPEDWDLSFERTAGSGAARGESGSIETLSAVPEGLSSHLLMQLRTTDLGAEELHVASYIIGNLNRDGYLESTTAEIAEQASCDPEFAESVLSTVQMLDPPGIGARNLTECLLIQLDQLGLRGSLAWRVVEKHSELLETKKHDQIARQEGVALPVLLEALSTVRRLEPRPGRPFLDEAPVFITPDVYVKRVGEDFVVTLNDSGIPRLRLSPNFREYLSKGERGEKAYLQERARSASWLIKNIQLRQQTILKVTKSIVEYQRLFFEQGVSGLKPLVLREVAQAVNLHESTISRVTSNKYVHTPHGVFELKFFFRSGIRSNEGDISSEAVKEKIRDLLERENPARPLSDQELSEKLHLDGISIARRTVAKYREAMSILPSSQRKRCF